MLKRSVLLMLALTACNGGDEPEKDDTDTDTDTDTDQPPEMVSVEVQASSTELTTREKATFTVMGIYDSGDSKDVTSDCSFSSSDSKTLLMIESEGQPVNGGSVDVTADCFSGSFSASINLNLTVALPQAGDLVINELLADGTVDGDPNDDGSANSVEDEFIEIANASDVTVDLSGVQLVEQDFAFLPRHTFAQGTVLKAGSAIVIFGGGDVSTLSADNVEFVTAQNDDPGQAYGLALTDSGDTLVVLPAEDGEPLARLAYGSEDPTKPTVSDMSLTLSPDVYGTEYKAHNEAGATDYSPGTFADGSKFVGPEGRYQPN